MGGRDSLPVALRLAPCTGGQRLVRPPSLSRVSLERQPLLRHWLPLSLAASVSQSGLFLPEHGPVGAWAYAEEMGGRDTETACRPPPGHVLRGTGSEGETA